MNTRINNLKPTDLTQYNMMLPKDKLPQYENIDKTPNYTNNSISRNVYDNKAKIQEAANYVAQTEAANTPKNKKVKVVSTAAKTENSKEAEEHNTSDKSTLTDVGGVLAKESLYRLTTKAFLKPNPYLVALSLLGVDPEEDGNALKKGAETGEIGDFAGDYNNYFNGMSDRASQSYLNAALEGFSLPANVISIGLQDCLQTVGVGLSKVLGKSPTVFIGSSIAAAGTALNAMGDIAADSLKGTVGVFKNLFTGDFDGVADSATDIYNGVKDSAVNVANAVADVATDGADVVVDAGEEVADIATDAANEVVDVAEDVGNGVVDAAETVGNGVADAAEEVGDAISDAADEVGDFFDSIF